jgi:tRNA pseudouridine55 synthase
MDGLLVIDKPAGPTSHDVVARVRRATGWPKVGHTGTLDPIATGVLPLVVGRATRLARFVSASDKEYEAEVRLGWATDTYDTLGTPIGGGATGQAEWPERPVLERLLEGFLGTRLQSPPSFSAKKIGGVRAYALARRGQAVAPREVPVTLYGCALLACDGDRLRLWLHCSAGFYVRSFAHELGSAIGPGAHLLELRRTRSGEFDEAAAVRLQQVEENPAKAAAALIPVDQMLTSLPAVVVSASGAIRATHGNELRPCDYLGPSVVAPASRVRVVDEQGRLLALAEAAPASGLLHPDIVVV